LEYIFNSQYSVLSIKSSYFIKMSYSIFNFCITFVVSVFSVVSVVSVVSIVSVVIDR